MSYQLEKIVTPDAMRAVEQIGYDQGILEEHFMTLAGQGIAKKILLIYGKRPVVLLAGKGNNAGDGFVALSYLLEQKIATRAIITYDLSQCSPLCQKKAKAYEDQGGVITKKMLFQDDEIVLDGLLGTGFKGELQGLLLQAVQSANRSGLPIVAIDIPSGIDGATGAATEAICAHTTICLGFYKLGCFINNGYECSGDIVTIPFGLPTEAIQRGVASAFLLPKEFLDDKLPVIKKTRHKYDAGYVLGVGGSSSMPGAPILSSLAAYRSGAGIVRLFHRSECSMPLEILHTKWDADSFFKELQRADSCFIGPGFGRDSEASAILEAILPAITIPTVLDADGLFFLANNLHIELPEQLILTPHAKEMERLLSADGQKFSNLEQIRSFTNKFKCTIILKGAPNYIFSGDKPPIIINRGCPGMATAGMGDLLTGMVASFLAQGVDVELSAILATYLHAVAAEKVAVEKTDFCLMASDVLDYLPFAFLDILGR